MCVRSRIHLQSFRLLFQYHFYLSTSLSFSCLKPIDDEGGHAMITLAAVVALYKICVLLQTRDCILCHLVPSCLNLFRLVPSCAVLFLPVPSCPALCRPVASCAILCCPVSFYAIPVLYCVVLCRPVTSCSIPCRPVPSCAFRWPLLFSTTVTTNQRVDKILSFGLWCRVAWCSTQVWILPRNVLHFQNRQS